MLKRTKEIARAAGEAVGVLTPTVPDALAAAEEHRQALIAAQAAFDKAEDALQAAHDRCADTSEITRHEAALAAARVELSRAEGRYRGAEKRLTGARDAEEGKKRAEHIAVRNGALAARAAVAAEIDALAVKMAEARRRYDSHRDALALAASAGVATPGFSAADGETVIRRALEKAGAVRSTWIGDRAHELGAADIAARDAGAVLSFQT